MIWWLGLMAHDTVTVTATDNFCLISEQKSRLPEPKFDCFACKQPPPTFSELFCTTDLLVAGMYICHWDLFKLWKVQAQTLCGSKQSYRGFEASAALRAPLGYFFFFGGRPTRCFVVDRPDVLSLSIRGFTVTVTVTGNLLNTKALTLVSRLLSQPFVVLQDPGLHKEGFKLELRPLIETIIMAGVQTPDWSILFWRCGWHRPELTEARQITSMSTSKSIIFRLRLHLLQCVERRLF